MSWVSQANLKTIMTAIRNKFTTGDLVIANDAKDTGVELNHTAQDGLVTVSPISTNASVESALHLSNGDDTKKTELTQGTLSYVTGTGDSEAYNYMSLLGNGVTFGKKGGGNVQVGGVADPTDAQQVATKNYVDKYVIEWIDKLAIKEVNLCLNLGSANYYELVIDTSQYTSAVQKIIEHCNISTVKNYKYDCVSFLSGSDALGHSAHFISAFANGDSIVRVYCATSYEMTTEKFISFRIVYKRT